MTEFDLSGGSDIRAGQSVSFSIWRHNTGRDIHESEWWAPVNGWAKLPTFEKMMRHELANRFRKYVEDKTPKTGDPLSVFRGRGIKDGTVPNSKQMGPPPTDGHVEDDGRYNKAGKAVLYLSSTDDGVRREQDAWNVEGVPYVQEFVLPLDGLRIADFTDHGDDFINTVFDNAERCKVSGFDINNYLFSQTVAEIVATKFDGMMVPGVRGDADSHYTNVVIFDPHEPKDRWHGWLHESDPRPLDDSSS